MTYCATNSTAGVNALRGRANSCRRDGNLPRPHGCPRRTDLDVSHRRSWIFVARPTRCACPKTVKSSTLAIGAGPVLRFDLRTLTLSSSSPDDGLTFAPNREGLMIGSWRNERSPSLNGRALPFINVRQSAKPRDWSRRQALLPGLELCT